MCSSVHIMYQVKVNTPDFVTTCISNTCLIIINNKVFVLITQCVSMIYLHAPKVSEMSFACISVMTDTPKGSGYVLLEMYFMCNLT